jgi:hypothetical protein
VGSHEQVNGPCLRAQLRRLFPFTIPLRRDLEARKEACLTLLASGNKVTKRNRENNAAVAPLNAFPERLRAVRVLDPAYGSGY